MLSIIRALMESLDLAVYSYVKPGAPHRFSPYFKDLHSFILTFTSALDIYAACVEAGFSVAEGRVGFTNLKIGDLLRDALRFSSRRLGARNIPEFHVVMIPAVIASSYAMKLGGRNFIENFRKGLNDALLFNDVSETIKVYESLKSYGGRYSSIIEGLMLTPTKIRLESVSIHDLYDEIGKEDPVLNYFTRKLSTLISSSNIFVNTYLKYGDANKAAVITYGNLVEELRNVRILNYLEKKSFTELLKLDKEMHSKGISLQYIIPLLCMSIFLGLLAMQH